ncbi:T9SS type A sorting domain-containing protein, partial [bacterium]|nr:T9SS type A sorting domain-containing protein [bacterium]
DGGIFIPAPPIEINSIRNIAINQGYRVFCSDNSSVTFSGEPLAPNTNYYALPNRWNWIGYPFDYGVDVINALGNIEGDLQIIQTDDGRIWIPSLGISTIGNMAPGEGYMVFLSSEERIDFTYTEAQFTRVNPKVNDIPEVEGAPEATGLPYAVIVTLSEKLKSLDPSVIELYDGNNLVGKNIVTNDLQYTPVIAWGGDEKHNLKGFRAGNEIGIRLIGSDGSILPVKYLDENIPVFGKDGFANLSLGVAHLPDEFKLEQGYPNPFNSTLTIPFSLPEKADVSLRIYNVSGQLVRELSSGSMNEGVHRSIWKGFTDHGLPASTGVYFVQLKANQKVHTRKIVLIK